MRIAESGDYDNLIAFLREDIPNCLYIYADLVSLGMDFPHLTFWISEKDGAIKNVVMNYYKSLQLYGEFDDDELSWVVEKVKKDNIGRITGSDTEMQRLEKLLDDSYSAHYGVIFRFDHSTEIDYQGVVTEAVVDDVPEIAELILTDKEVFGGYTFEELSEQLTDRISNKTGRSFIIRKDNKIIGHISFMIETDMFCVSSWIIVHPEYRDFRYALQLQHAAFEATLRDKKDHYFFIEDPRRAKMFEVTGNPIVAKYGKLNKV